jgi:hypothetical protein
MTDLTKGRGLIYIAGLIAGALALAGYADFDPATWMIDIHPFNLREFLLTGTTTAGNLLAAVAVFRGWGKK